MLSFLLNYEEFSNYQDKIDNLNSHFLESFKDENQLIDVQNQNKEFEINDIFLQDNNAYNSIITTKETKNYIFDSIYFDLAKADANKKIFLNKKRNHEKAYDDSNRDIFELKENEEKMKEKENIEINNEIKKDRRKKDAEYNKKAVHDKFKKDNIIKKIKNNIFDYILERKV